METIASVFKQAVKKFGNKNFCSSRPRFRTIKWSYNMLYNYATGIAAILEKHHVQKGDRIIIISPNSPFWVGTFFGAFLKGCVVVPLNPQSMPAFFEKIAKETDAKVVFKSSFLKYNLNLDIPIIEIDYLGDLVKKTHSFKETLPNPQDTAEIVYTSGTTGDPKGVVLSHKNIISNLSDMISVFRVSSNDRTVSVLPLFHMYEQTVGLLGSLYFGIDILYSPGVSSSAIRASLIKQKATKMLVVPELLETIMSRIDTGVKEAGKEKLFNTMLAIASKLPFFMRRFIFRRVHKSLGGHLDLFIAGGAALSAEVQRKWELFGIKILQGYGLTETSPGVSSNTFEYSRYGSVGKAFPSVEIVIADDREIRVKGPNVFSGYYRNETRTKEVFDEKGYFKTGDLGYFDKDGFLFVNGRKKYMILSSSGENIYPEDIETELKKNPQVNDAAVIGIPRNGNEIVYAVLLGEIDNPSKVIENANSNLASYQRIIDWAVWPEADFPRSATRKVKKEEVIAWVKSAHAKKTASAQEVVHEKVSPIVMLLSAICGKKLNEIHPDSNLSKDLHFDSLLRIELVGQIEDKFDISVDESLITHKTTVKDLEELLEAQKVKSKTKKRKFKTWYLNPFVRYISEICAWILSFPIYFFYIDLKVEGLENLKDSDMPLIFMSNHISYIDAAIILRALPGKIRRKVAIAAAFDFMYQHYWYIAWLLEILFNTYPFPRREEENIKPGLDATGNMLDRGFSILIFPEGKINDTNAKLLPLKSGAGFLAVEMDVPIVPVIIEGGAKIIPKDKILPRKRGTMTIKFGKPIKFHLGDSYIDATKKIESAMKEML